MRKLCVISWIAASLVLVGGAAGFAAPLNGLDLNAGQDEVSRADDARVFCYNRYSGRFIHWGSCGSSHPRVYCRNRYTGRFLHWGSCY